MTTTTSEHSAGRNELDNAFATLSHVTRRRVLTALARDDPRRAEEFETAGSGHSARTRETTAIRLQHDHLPKLDEAGYVDWDRGTGEVRRGAAFETVRPLLDLMDEYRAELPDDRG